MTNKSDTPETDIVIGNVDSITPRPPQEELIYIKYSKMLHHARRLERELADLRAENELMRPVVEAARAYDIYVSDIERLVGDQDLTLSIDDNEKRIRLMVREHDKARSTE